MVRGGDSNLNTGIRILPSKVLERRIPRSYFGFDSKVKAGVRQKKVVRELPKQSRQASLNELLKASLKRQGKQT